MKNKIITFLLAAAFGINSLSAAKPVTSTVEIMPNYLWHLFALSNIWDTDNNAPYFKNYSEKYGASVSAEDLSYLYEHRDLIAWGNGNAGLLTGFLFFGPLSESITPEEYFTYLDIISRSIKNSDWTEFTDKYWLKPDLPPFESINKPKEEDLEAFNRIRDIIIRNYPTYRDRMWPEIKTLLEAEKIKIDSAFEGKQIIEQWEKALNLKYSGSGFYPVLTYVNAAGFPSANNLSDTRNNFGVSADYTDNTIDLIIHEIGIFTMMPLVSELLNAPDLQTKFNLEHNVVYQSFESYIEKKKGDITGERRIWEGEMHGSVNFNFPFFFKFYDENEGKYDTKQLIIEAIKAYNKEFDK